MGEYRRGESRSGTSQLGMLVEQEAGELTKLHGIERDDLMSSVAFWYQIEPHEPWPAIPPGPERLPFHERTLLKGYATRLDREGLLDAAKGLLDIVLEIAVQEREGAGEPGEVLLRDP